MERERILKREIATIVHPQNEDVCHYNGRGLPNIRVLVFYFLTIFGL